MRNILFVLLKKLNLDPTLCNTHSFRGGRSLDILKIRYSLSAIKSAGCWHSNAVYKYRYIHNNYVQIIKEQILLPKAVIVVLEDDMVKAADHYKKGTSSILAPRIHWLITNIFKLTNEYKKNLPTKSCRFKYPQFFWVPAVLHDAFGIKNLYREKFNDCLKETVGEMRGHKILDLPTWNRHDFTLCNYGNLNQAGLKKIWIAINDAFQAWDRDQMKRMQNNVKSSRNHRQNDRFHWRRDTNPDHQPRRKMPRPPPED